MLRENDLIALPKEIGELIRLRELHIQGNRLTVLPPEFGEFLCAGVMPLSLDLDDKLRGMEWLSNTCLLSRLMGSGLIFRRCNMHSPLNVL